MPSAGISAGSDPRPLTGPGVVVRLQAPQSLVRAPNAGRHGLIPCRAGPPESGDETFALPVVKERLPPVEVEYCPHVEFLDFDTRTGYADPLTCHGRHRFL